MFQFFNFEEEPMSEEEQEKSTLGKFKKGSSVKKSQKAEVMETQVGSYLLK